MDLGMGEIILILVFALLVYGGRLPEVARSLGRAIATVKRNLQETTAEVARGADVAETPDDARPRTVRRVQPAAPEALAKEDVSATPPAAPGTPAAPPPADPA